jgi:hypothetical protein
VTSQTSTVAATQEPMPRMLGPYVDVALMCKSNDRGGQTKTLIREGSETARFVSEGDSSNDQFTEDRVMRQGARHLTSR